MKPDYTVELINNQTKLTGLVNRLASVPFIALDIETVDWWNRRQERVALIQIAFRIEKQTKVAIVDALARLDLEPLRPVFESEKITKVIHNAVFDASRLDRRPCFRKGGRFRCRNRQTRHRRVD